MKSLLVVVLLFFGLNTFAAWNDLIAKVVSEGTSSDTPLGVELRSLSKQTDTSSLEYQTDHITTVGRVDGDGAYHVQEVHFVSEKWIKDTDENWHVDQWLFYVATNGTLKSYIMQELIKYKDGSTEINKLKVSAAKAASVFIEKKNMWLNN